MPGLPADARRLLLDPQAVQGLRMLDVAIGGIVLAIGPEGGWSGRDLATLRGNGFEGLRLGPRVLRTETAGIAAIAALQARHGDFA
jgi:16S rRNA (uracil1498-N3)-methyltransferase